jgi:hypothetical protein
MDDETVEYARPEVSIYDAICFVKAFSKHLLLNKTSWHVRSHWPKKAAKRALRALERARYV